MVTDLPKYMTGVLKFDIHRTGTLAALPYAVMWLSSIAFGWICDKFVKKNWLTVTNARKTFTTIGMYNANANCTYVVECLLYLITVSIRKTIYLFVLRCWLLFRYLSFRYIYLTTTKPKKE